MDKLLLSIAFIMASFLALPAVADYAFTSLDVPGAISTTPTSINDSGQVAGWYTVAPRDYSFAFVESNGVFTPLHVPGVGGAYNE